MSITLTEKFIAFRKHARSKENSLRYTQLNTIRLRAESKGIVFDIKSDDLLWPTHCPILGIELVRGGDRHASPSVDRVDPSKGYVKDNVRIISKLANSMKQDATKKELETFCERIIPYINGEI